MKRPFTLRERMLMAAPPVLWMMAGYYVTQRIAWRPVWWLDIGSLEDWVPFSPHAIWVYGTFHAWFLLPFLVLRNRRLVRRYAWAFFWVATVSIGIFMMFPNGVVRPDTNGEVPWLYALCRQLDLPRNGFPSLHASITVLAAALLDRSARRLRRPALWRMLIWLWTAAICWSCIALRQHVALDVLGGVVIGAGAAWWALRPATETRRTEIAPASA